MNRFYLIFIILISHGSLLLMAQGQTPANFTQSDTLGQDNSGLFNESNKNTFRVLFSGKPGRAALYSLVIPGAGQFYNKRYWKIPIVYAGIGAVSYLFWNPDNGANTVYQETKDLYEASFGTDQETIYYNYYLQAKKTREQFIFAFIGVHLFNVFDAYIDRHLIDFDMSDDLSIHILPYPDGISPVGITVALELSGLKW